MVGDWNTSLRLSIWLPEGWVSLLEKLGVEELVACSIEWTNESVDPCGTGDGAMLYFFVSLFLLVLALRLPRSKLARLKSLAERSVLLRLTSMLRLPNSPLVRGLGCPLPDENGTSVARTVSWSMGVASTEGLSGLRLYGFSPLGICEPSRERDPSQTEECERKFSGIFCAVVSSTMVCSTLRASVPKLKNEKKY